MIISLTCDTQSNLGPFTRKLFFVLETCPLRDLFVDSNVEEVFKRLVSGITAIETALRSRGLMHDLAASAMALAHMQVQLRRTNSFDNSNTYFTIRHYQKKLI